MVDEAQIKEAVDSCQAAILRSSDPKATINEFCAALANVKGWTDGDIAVVQLRVRRATNPPDYGSNSG